MQKGLNSDLEVKGNSFHIQTEDWGRENPYIVSRVYKNGAVIRSQKTPYSQVLSNPFCHEEEIRIALKSQHKGILDLLVAGNLS